VRTPETDSDTDTYSDTDTNTDTSADTDTNTKGIAVETPTQISVYTARNRFIYKIKIVFHLSYNMIFESKLKM